MCYQIKNVTKIFVECMRVAVDVNYNNFRSLQIYINH
jgi:hypothetical protein